MPIPLYIALCLVVPVVWAVLSARLFDWWQERQTSRAPAGTPVPESPDMYYI